MIISLPDTNVSAVAKALVQVREEGGAVALGRVLTLIISSRHGAMEDAIDAANGLVLVAGAVGLGVWAAIRGGVSLWWPLAGPPGLFSGR